jgi:PAS domain S-box-containing protein
VEPRQDKTASENDLIARLNRAEEALRARELNFQLIVDSIPAQVAVITPTGEVQTLNQPCLEYFGKTLDELKGWAASDPVHPDDLPHVIKVLTHALETGETYEVESRHRRFDGVYRWFHVRGFPLKDIDGSILRWCVLLNDIDDRKRAETQRDRTIEELRAKQSMLSESEQRFRAIFDEAGAGIAVVDLQQPDRPIQTNRALQTMLGITQEQLGFAETYDALTAAADREADAATYRELCEGKRNSLRQEKHFVRQNGSSVFANVIFTMLRDAAGLPRFIVAIHEDITERNRALEKLQANQDLLDLAQKAARAMAFDWYIQEPINTWSPEQESLYGLAPGTFDGRYESWRKLVHPNDWPLIVKALKHAQETGDILVEYRVVWPDGSTHWLAANGQMFVDDKGHPERMVGFTADVTRRKLAEEELRRSEAFLAEAQRLSSIGSFSWLVATDELAWSDELYRIYELDPGIKITLEVIRTRVHPEDLTLYEKMVEQARNGSEDFEWQYRLLMPDQSIKYMHAVAQATRDPSGQLEYIAAVRDVTARRVSDEALDKARSELAHVTRVMTLGALTASIAHEVNQPLSGIITNASTCMRMLDADPPNVDGARETAKRTIRDGRRAADVITKLRALFTHKDGTTELVDLNEAAREVIALSRTELERNRVITKIELDDELPPVMGDRVQLQQVILNLLRNGSDAMSDVDDRPRELLFRTEVGEGDRVRLSVQDAGVGFEPQSLDRLFQTFYTTKEEGMGIGLAVSHSIIENHRGRMWATPNDGQGVTFSFSIPCVVDREPDVDGS